MQRRRRPARAPPLRFLDLAGARAWHRTCCLRGGPTGFLRPPPETSTVLDDFAIRVLALSVPGLLPDRLLHRAALAAVAAGRHGEAGRLFESAASAYRSSLDVEGLARLRVHQRMASARACGDPVREAEMMLEIVRGVNRLERLESFRAPHELMNARAVLSEWLGETGLAFDADAGDARQSA